ncbi:MAG: AraC family transcriptional regulator [Mesorhizobium sp.]|nr:AraC family transcriptional regulator [Mesorhizobium sp.]
MLGGGEGRLFAPPTVLASAASGVIDMIQVKGGSPEAVFASAAIRMSDVGCPTNELNLHQYCTLFEQAARQTGNDNFGLEFGQQFQPRELGPLGYAATSSPTLGAALRNVEAYFPAHQGQSTFSFVPEGDIIWLSYQITDPRIEGRRQDAELSLGMFCNIFRHALGRNWAPLEVRFEHPKPDGASDHSRYFNAPVEFGRPTNAFAFRRDVLGTKMPEPDPYLFAIIEALLRSRRDYAGDPQDVVGVLRNQIRMHLNERTPGVQDIARILGLSSATLQRQLKELGVTYNDILRSTREELALHYLKNSDMPLTDVALSLGYSELSAFSRAFRNWTGMSPHRFRRLGTLAR